MAENQSADLIPPAFRASRTDFSSCNAFAVVDSRCLLGFAGVDKTYTLLEPGRTEQMYMEFSRRR